MAGTEILAYVNRVREVEAANVDHATMTLEQIESNPVRCPDQASADLMYQGKGGGLRVAATQLVHLVQVKQQPTAPLHHLLPILLLNRCLCRLRRCCSH